MTRRTEDFMTRFNQVEQFLREMTDSERHVPFGALISEAGDANAVVRHYARDLREYADLRNAVVHEHPRGKVIAEITPEAFAEFESIVETITSPPAVFPRFQRDVRVFKESDPLMEAVEDLWREDYSQVIVRRNGKMTLLSYAGITRWMGKDVRDKTIDLDGVTVGRALEFEKQGGIAFLPRHATIFDARELFQPLASKSNQRLRVIVITENGNPKDAPLGLLTASDILESENGPA